MYSTAISFIVQRGLSNKEHFANNVSTFTDVALVDTHNYHLVKHNIGIHYSPPRHRSRHVSLEHAPSRKPNLNAKARRELVFKIKSIRAQLATETDNQDLAKQYRELKHIVRESAATEIQKRFRGYMTRKPLRIPLGSRSNDPVYMAKLWLHEQRRKGGRILPCESWNAAMLTVEKKCIKKLLAKKHYEVIQKHGRAPNMQDKESYRPIYQLYHKIKQLIDDLSNADALSLTSSGGSKEQLTETMIATLRAEKRALQLKLNQYEKLFQKQKGRKIKFQHDVAPVRVEWGRYKKLKLALAQFEDKESVDAM
jgi:hypothetical protein